MDDEVEASTERVRHHLRRPLAGSRNLLMKTAENTLPVTDPAGQLHLCWSQRIVAWREFSCLLRRTLSDDRAGWAATCVQ